MLQITYIRDNKDTVLTGLRKKRFAGAAEAVEQLIELDRKRRETQSELDATLAQANTLAKEIGALLKAGKKEEAEKNKAETSKLKSISKELADVLEATEKQLNDLLVTVPNLPHTSVPEGKSAEDNEVVYQHGTLPDLPQTALPHWELIKKYDIIDFELGVKITGAGFPVYKGKGARIQRALINFFLDEAAKAGYVEIQPPIVINRESGFGTGQLPDKDGQMYYIPEEGFYLIPTAEVPITNIYR